MRGSAFSRCEQFETSPETIEQELRSAVCELRQTNFKRKNYSIDVPVHCIVTIIIIGIIVPTYFFLNFLPFLTFLFTVEYVYLSCLRLCDIGNALMLSILMNVGLSTISASESLRLRDPISEFSDEAMLPVIGLPITRMKHRNL